MKLSSQESVRQLFNLNSQVNIYIICFRREYMMTLDVHLVMLFYIMEDYF